MPDSVDWFEPEILFPTRPIDAARVFLGAMAYPERGAGTLGSPGCEFTGALGSLVVWSRRKAKGLRQIRNENADPTFKPPELREFSGLYSRGRRRLRRRSAAYGLVGTQLLSQFFRSDVEHSRQLTNAAGHPHSRAHDTWVRVSAAPWGSSSRSPFAVISANPKAWSKRLALNRPIDAADMDQKTKDLVRRAYLQSRPVLHMAHAFNSACAEVGPTCPGWGGSDFLLVMLANCEKWVWQAIDSAERWRLASHLYGLPNLEPRHMITLKKPAS